MPQKTRLLRHFVPRNDKRAKVIAKRCLLGHSLVGTIYGILSLSFLVHP
ncbi:MAG: hypothetical protein AB1444_14040 [Spirochaetota bacterium]